MALKLDGRWAAADCEQRGGDVKLETSRRWYRLAIYSDPPPRMSHIGFWRTRACDLRGINLRFKLGGRYITCLAHTRRTWRLQ